MTNQRIAVVTDTNCGMLSQEADRQGIYLVPMPVLIDEETYFENETISQKDFFNRLRQGAEVCTSQPSPGSILDIWDKVLETYDKLIYLPMSSGLSGSCETAKVLASEYDQRVYVVDNHRISVTLRQSVLEAKYLVLQGKDADEIVQYLENDGLEASIYVAVDTMEYLKKGGRVTAAGAAIGTFKY